MSASGGTERPAFDPRHDARFQRGYRPGEENAAPAARPRQNTPVATPTSAGSTPAGSFAQGAARAVSPRSGDSAATPEFDDLVNDDPDSSESDSLDLDLSADSFQDEPASSRWNPFIVLLWVLGATFVAAGLVLQWHAVQGMFGGVSYPSDGAPVELLLRQFSYVVAPALIMPGLVIIAGLLFWHARAWQVRRRPRPEAPLG